MKTFTKISAILLALGMFVAGGQAVAGPADGGESLFDRIYSE